jgi:uncharacterized membrane protein
MELTPGTAVAVYYLVAIGLASLLFVYLAVRAVADPRAGSLRVRARHAIGPFAVAALGGGLLAVWAWMAQPLPGDYNLLFQDLYFFFAVVLPAIAIALVIVPSSDSPAPPAHARAHVPG